MEIKNKIVIVTGASQGIGLALAKTLTQEGAKVVLAARDAEILKKYEKELAVRRGFQPTCENPVTLKISSKKRLKNMAE